MNKRSLHGRITDETKGIAEYSAILRQEKKHLKALRKLKATSGRRP